MEADDSMGRRLRDERERLKQNQTDFAALAGATRQTQSNYEKGERVPDAVYLAAIAAAGADVQYILTGVRTGTAEPQGRYELTPRKKKLLDLIEMLDEKGQEEIQEELEKIKRMKEMERELAELKKQAKGNQNKV